ncbi:PREDICTED: hypoxia-inducible factor 1-alpha [Ceratosolen solmsi marchali]|uniref:Hypoxia-inducible factor 1-alpha n=1 Tax=Ceratosolen solmsi marchali TaxID=326594 RepID=A0AAJ6YUH7_9HYME|nr:PREDICTED: hypoxia-inducible factor 1-alpha [Ceratosolen solmsi marchali]
MMSGPVDVEDLGNFYGLTNQLQSNIYPFPYKSCVYGHQQQQSPGYYESTSLENAVIAYCTDSKWISCPVANYCPLYEASPLQSLQILPCVRDVCGYYTAEDDILEEFLSNEKRKEKSRDAARCRRSRETDIFTELAAALPVSPCEAAHLDKASVMRLAIAYLKARTLMDAFPKLPSKSESSPEIDELFLKALDGFILILDNNGDMVYLSQNVKDHLGISQMDLMGQSVFDYSHPCDHDEIRDSFSLKASEINIDHPCNFFLRLKCTLTSKGRKVNLKSASYKVIHCMGRLIALLNTSKNENTSTRDLENQEENDEKQPGIFLVVVASPVPHPSNIEIPLGKYTFLSKHNLNMKFTYADDKLAEFLGWESNELIGQSVFDFHHALDNLSLDKYFKSLFSKGQCETMAYRFLNKSGGYAWVVTQATLIHCSRLQKPLSVVCVNYLLSGIERKDEVYSLRQLEVRDSRLKDDRKENTATPQPRAQVLESSKPVADKPISVTASLFRYQERTKPQQAVRLKLDDKENDINDVKVNVNSPVCEVELKQQLPPVYITSSIPDSPIYQTPISNNSSRPPPQTATASIFAPRTKDMNKGFLTFSEDQPGLTMLKDEPEDLTHLAPTAGDVCVPLEDPPFLSDMLDEFILHTNYCPLLSPELPSGTPELTESVCNGPVISNIPCQNKEPEQAILGESMRRNKFCSTDSGDPFIYRDSPSRCSLTTDLHSPTLSKSPEGSGAGDSLSSPNGSGDSGLFEDEMLMLSISDVMADDELTLRAPYIPMSDQDEALQLLISDDMVMWSPSQSTDKKSKWLTDTGEDNANSSLAQLLTSEISSKKIKDREETLVNPTHGLGQINLKNTTKNITADRERTNKRVHTFCNKSNHEIKRIKHNDSNITNNNNLSSLESILSVSIENSPLLQQLASQQATKNRNWQNQVTLDTWSRNGNNIYEDSSLCRIQNLHKIIIEDDGGGKTKSHQHQHQLQQQQSNSVLMNLLVSGCDVQDLESQFDERMSGNHQKPSNLQIYIEEQLQHVPQWSNSTPNFGSSKRQKVYEPINYEEELGFISTASIVHESDELLRTLEPNLA